MPARGLGTRIHPITKRGNKKKRRSPWQLGADVGAVEIRGSVAELGDAGSRCASASGSTVRDVVGVVEGVADSLWTGRRVAELGVRIDADVLVLLSGGAGLGSTGLGEDETCGTGGSHRRLRGSSSTVVRQLGRLLRCGVGLGHGEGAAALPLALSPIVWRRRDDEGVESEEEEQTAALYRGGTFSPGSCKRPG